MPANVEMVSTEVASVTNAVLVSILLIWIGDFRTVVRGVEYAIAIPIRVTRIASAVAIYVLLIWIDYGWTVVDTEAPEAEDSVVGAFRFVPVYVSIADVSQTISVEIFLVVVLFVRTVIQPIQYPVIVSIR